MIPKAITGLGIVSCAGVGREAFFDAMRAPVLLWDSPRAPIESFDGSKYPDAVVAEVPNFDPTKYLGDKGLRTLDRLTKLLVVAARLCMQDAGLKQDGAYIASSPDRVGLCCSNAYGSLEAITELDRVAKLEDARYINPAKFPNTVSNSASGYASIWEDLRALNISVSDGNCGALDAIACAEVHVETGRADALLVGGAEALSEALYLAFHKLGAIEKGAHIGEGAALMSIEPVEYARHRHARILAQVTGYGTAFIARDDAALIQPSRDAMERAINHAIADANMKPADIDVVASSVSGLTAFDNEEYAAIERVFGRHICIAAPKYVLGETLGAGGAMAMAAALTWLFGTPPAPRVRGRVPERVQHVLVTSMGYYGNASAVVLARAS